MRLSEYLRLNLSERLNEARLVVWYDGERAFSSFVSQLHLANTDVVAGVTSELVARREAEAAFRQLEEAGLPAANGNLLIYLPRSRYMPDRRAQDPFEVFAVAGDVFGEAESEHLHSLARAAAPELAEQIDGLFLAGHPTLDLLDNLRATSAYPLVEQALGTQSAVEVAAQVLGTATAFVQLENVSGAQAETLRLLQAELGFTSPPRTKAWVKLRDKLAEFVLMSELAFDLPGDWPAAIDNVARADLPLKDRIYSLCERWRGDDELREAFIAQANRIEANLGLRQHFAGVQRLGVRDTFAFEERQYLAALTQAVQSGRLGSARDILAGRRRSVWRHLAERAQVWQVAERCVDLMQTAADLVATGTSSLRMAGLVETYTRADGWHTLDRQQRLMEQSWADCTEREEVAPTIELARSQYRQALSRLQGRFLKRVEQDGWPPEGLLRQTQVFDKLVAPALERRVKVAYVLADSLRFEMGQALAGELAELGDVGVQPAAAALPTITPNGVAALMAGADGALSLRNVGEQLVPHIGDRPLKDSAARMALLAEKYGDRFGHLPLADWLEATEKKRASLAQRDLLVLRSQDIDELGENVSLRQARKHISGLLGELKAAIVQLARVGFDIIVVAADHGHVLLPEVLAGDSAAAPDGQWALSKRRLRMGKAVREQAGSLVFDPQHLGIQTDAADYVVASGFGVYQRDAAYFHEGLSLPECIIPVIEFKPRGRPVGAGREQSIELRFGRDRFTSQVIGLKVYYASLLNEPLRVRLEAYDVANPSGKPVGEAADSPVRDEDTHEVTLAPNAETSVPLLIEPGFTGQAVELRAIAPDSNVVWARLKLKNGVMD
ncbi:MAG: PglZ domain-containing protein [Anaerolineales bacterium]|nr:PglZ domain-containing protein [Anaerolineales bacterium]